MLCEVPFRQVVDRGGLPRLFGFHSRMPPGAHTVPQILCFLAGFIGRHRAIVANRQPVELAVALMAVLIEETGLSSPSDPDAKPRARLVSRVPQRLIAIRINAHLVNGLFRDFVSQGFPLLRDNLATTFYLQLRTMVS